MRLEDVHATPQIDLHALYVNAIKLHFRKRNYYSNLSDDKEKRD